MTSLQKIIATAYINSAIKNAARTLLSDKSQITGFRQQRSGCVYYYPGIASRVEVPGTPYRMSGTLEFSSCASIAPDRRALSERAEHASFARRSGNRRRSARGTKFHLVPRFLYGVPGTSDFTDDDLNCNIALRNSAASDTMLHCHVRRRTHLRLRSRILRNNGSVYLCR